MMPRNGALLQTRCSGGIPGGFESLRVLRGTKFQPNAYVSAPMLGPTIALAIAVSGEIQGRSLRKVVVGDREVADAAVDVQGDLTAWFRNLWYPTE